MLSDNNLKGIFSSIDANLLMDSPQLFNQIGDAHKIIYTKLFGPFIQ